MGTILLSLLLALALVIAACGTNGEEGSDGLSIVATTSIWGDVVRQIVGDDATVEVLMPIGADAHDFQATSRQVASIGEADLVVANGLGLEEGLADVLDAAAEDGANILELAPELDPIPFAGHEHENHAEETEHDGDLDPHVWFDPRRVATAATLIAEHLADIVPSVDWGERALEYSEDMLGVDEELMLTFDQIPIEERQLVTNHESLGYLADRYGFEVIGVVIPGGSTMAEPSSAEMAALVEEIEHEGVTAIFAETSESADLAEAVASEVGYDVSVVELYTESLGEPESGAETLARMLVTNANLIVVGLS